MKPATVDQIGNLCAGKRVALVGNSPSIMLHEHGPEIDAHDVVVRMNGGVPGFGKMVQSERPDKSKPARYRPDHRVPTAAHIGERTDILTLATFRIASRALRLASPKIAVWMKLTKIGASDLRQLMTWGCEICTACWQCIHLVKYPRDWDHALGLEIGCAPSSGPRMLHLLFRQHAREVTLYGFDCFGAVSGGEYSSWWGFQYFGGKRLSHDGAKELAWLRGQGYEFDSGVGRRSGSVVQDA